MHIVTIVTPKYAERRQHRSVADVAYDKDTFLRNEEGKGLPMTAYICHRMCSSMRMWSREIAPSGRCLFGISLLLRQPSCPPRAGLADVVC